MTCADFLQPLLDWLKAPIGPLEYRAVSCLIVSNDRDGPARYAEGWLKPALVIPPINQQPSDHAMLKGTADLYESTARWGHSTGTGTDYAQSYPFHYENHKVQVSIGVTTGRVTLNSTSKGTAVIANPECSGFVLFGFATDGSGALGVGGGSFVGMVGADEHATGGPGTGTQPPTPHVPVAVVRPYYIISLKRVSGTQPA